MTFISKDKYFGYLFKYEFQRKSFPKQLVVSDTSMYGVKNVYDVTMYGVTMFVMTFDFWHVSVR